MTGPSDEHWFLRFRALEAEVTQLRAALADLTPSPDGGYGHNNAAAWKDAYIERLNEALAAERLAHDRGEALERIAENAEAWHGPNNAGSGHAKALAVIASWAREALAGVVPPEQAPEPTP